MKLSAALLAFALTCAAPALAQSRHLAPGFAALPKSATVVLMPADVELFSISAGGVFEPRADWTEAALRHFNASLAEKKRALGVPFKPLTDADLDQFAELVALHRAVASAIGLHHFGSSALLLPTKEKRLDWSLGPSVQAIRRATGADYALFTWVRDSYASEERKATMLAFAVLGAISFAGGIQAAYASLVELETGRIVWFGDLFRSRGDLRNAESAREVLDALFTDFPAPR
ncbi:MAG TPA: hypothetical protein VD965_08695 [Burkholderiales bacterium]|nr:hypothetical protein [Burkholderiales bacterium]